MTPPVPLTARLAILISTLFWAFLLIIFLLGLPVLLAISPKVAAGFAVTALVLAIILTWLIRLVIYTQSLRSFFLALIKPFLFLLCLLVGLVAIPIYYLAYKAEVTPLALPRAEISNGEKIIVFQGVTPFANQAFYKQINYEMEKALTEEYKLFYEGVKASTPEADSWFATTTTGNLHREKYQSMAKACGIQYRANYFDGMQQDMEQNPERHLIADTDTAQLKQEFDRLMRDDNAFAFSVNVTKTEPGKNLLTHYFETLIDAIRRNTEGQPTVVNSICAGTFTIIQDTQRLAENPLDKLIFNLRNQHLVNAVLTDPASKLYIAYNPAHLEGLVEQLHKTDPRWEIKSLTWSRDITHPDKNK